MDTKKTTGVNHGYVFAHAAGRNVPNPAVIGSTDIKPLVYIVKDHPEITSLPKGYKSKKCAQCGESLYVYSYTTRLYCGYKCTRKAYKARKFGPLPTAIQCRICNKTVRVSPQVARVQLYCGTKHRKKWFRLVHVGKPVPVFLDRKTVIYTKKYDKIAEIKELYKTREKVKLGHRVKSGGKQIAPDLRRPSWYEPGMPLPKY